MSGQQQQQQQQQQQPALSRVPEWFYLDQNANQQGPTSLASLGEFIQDGAISGETYAWKEGMVDWAPLSHLPPLAAVIERMKKQGPAVNQAAETGDGWLYMDKYRAQQGPVPTGKLMELYRSFQVNDLTLCWRKGMAEWQKLGMVEALQAQIQRVMIELQGGGGGGGGENEQAQATSSSSSSSLSAEAAAAAAPPAQLTPEELEAKRLKKEKQIAKRKRQKEKGRWKKQENHANVYVTGLPDDVTKAEVHDHFKKAGILKKEPGSIEPKIKLYKDKEGNLKGDGLVCYLNEPSVGLAIELLDDSFIRPAYKVTVAKAEFKMKGDSFVKKKKPKTADGKTAKVRKALNNQHKALSWNDGIEQGSGLKIVILLHMFEPKEATNDPSFYDDLKLEVGMECERKCGPLEKVTVFKGSPVGAIALKFKGHMAASKCIELMNGRFFGGRTIECIYFDGKTDYRVGESEEAQAERIKAFGDWLESDEQQ